MPTPAPRQIRTRRFPPSGSSVGVARGDISQPPAVMVTCLPTSRRWTWVPPEDHTNTGRLCSAGSRCHPVPRRPRSYAALRLPAPISHGSGSPCRWLTSMRALVLCHVGRRHVRPHTRRASETGHRLSATPECVEERRGPPGLRGRPLRTCHGRTPRRIPPPPRPEMLAGDGYPLKAGQLIYDCRYSTMPGMPITGGRGFRGLKPLWYNGVPP